MKSHSAEGSTCLQWACCVIA